MRRIVVGCSRTVRRTRGSVGVRVRLTEETRQARRPGVRQVVDRLHGFEKTVQRFQRGRGELGARSLFTSLQPDGLEVLQHLEDRFRPTHRTHSLDRVSRAQVSLRSRRCTLVDNRDVTAVDRYGLDRSGCVVIVPVLVGRLESKGHLVDVASLHGSCEVLNVSALGVEVGFNLQATLIFSKANLDRLLNNSVIKDCIKYVARLTEAEILNALADVLGVKNILVGRGIYNTAKEGKTFINGDIWNASYAMVAVIGDANRLSDPSVGRTFLWSSDSPENATVEQYRDDASRSDIFRVRQHVDEIVIDPYFAHLMKVA